MWISWDSNNAFWDANITERSGDAWLVYSEVPMPMGETLTATGMAGMGCPQFELDIIVVERGTNDGVSPFSEKRFWSRVRPASLSIEFAEQLFPGMKAA